MSLTRNLYEGFQRRELHRWDALVADDVIVNSTMGRGITGLDALKQWASQFLDALRARVDLIEEFELLDGKGNGRAVFTVCLHWKHESDFMGVAPTGREGTVIETMLLTVEHGKVVRWDVANQSLDLTLYFWQRGWPLPHNVVPTPLIEGVSHRSR